MSLVKGWTWRPLGKVPVALKACIGAGDPPFPFKHTVWGDGEGFIVRTTSKADMQGAVTNAQTMMSEWEYLMIGGVLK